MYQNMQRECKVTKMIPNKEKNLGKQVVFNKNESVLNKKIKIF
jgi:hypothetical protein